MSAETFWLAVAMVLVIEGLFPLIAPGAWRRVFIQLVQMNDDQIRSFAIVSIVLGLVGIWLLAP